MNENPAAGSQCSHFLFWLQRTEHGDKIFDDLGDVIKRHFDGICSVEGEHKLYLLRDIHEVVHGDKVSAYLWL